MPLFLAVPWVGLWSVMMAYFGHTVNPVLSGKSKKDQTLVFNTEYRLMQVKSNAACSQGEHSAILSTLIKLPFFNKTFDLSFFK